MSPDKHSWSAEYFIEQGNKITTYQVSYIEEGTTSPKHLEEDIYFYGHHFTQPKQFKSTSAATLAARQHADRINEKRRQGMRLQNLGKLP